MEIKSEYVYKCNHCGEVFPRNELQIIEKRGCYESDYGVGDLFSDHHYYTEEYGICPNCGECENYDSGMLCVKCEEFVEDFSIGREDIVICDECLGEYTEEEYIKKYFYEEK